MSTRIYHLHAPGAMAFTARHAARPADTSADTKRVNQHSEARNSYPSRASGALLDKGQKAHLCILAREAFERMHRRPPHDQHELDRWRREQQQRATGLVSLCDADQRHWPALQAAFLDLNGESGRAFAVLVAPDLREQRKALAVLERNCLAAGQAFPAYPSAICRQQYKCTLEEASPKQLWRLVFTVRNRRKKAAQPEDNNAPF
jgi:hypothetical protein